MLLLFIVMHNTEKISMKQYQMQSTPLLGVRVRGAYSARGPARDSVPWLSLALSGSSSAGADFYINVIKAVRVASLWAGRGTASGSWAIRGSQKLRGRDFEARDRRQLV